ncbi:MarR family winged helix-turn-helix transcriptional regulator [Dermatophilus congolensis]|uniref:MarR family winged helix-turn-helix transcriptional regulator n=1 Tax=Dermatophilus congolensis TaxID=1863 RepID=UPI001AAFE031
MTPQDPPTAHYDEVDRIVAAWERELPNLDATPLHVLSRISRLSRHLEFARRSAFEANNLEPWEFDVLSALRRAGSPFEMSPGELVHDTLSTSGTMTNRIARLEKRGLVTRHRDPHDGRSMRIRLTTAGKNAAENTLTALIDRENDLLAALGNTERNELINHLRHMLLSFD